MGFLSSLFSGPEEPAERLRKIAEQSAQRQLNKPKRGGLRGLLFGASDRQFNQALADEVRGGQREQYYEHERQKHEEERLHHQVTRPRYVYELEQSYRVPYYKAEVDRLKQEGSPYASQMETQLQYAQREVDKHLRSYDHEWERQQYQRKYAFAQQQKDYAKQVSEQAYTQRDSMLDQMKRRQAQQQALSTQSNIGRGRGRGGEPLGRGQRFSRFGPPQARGSFGRGGSRPTFTQSGK